MARSDTGTGQWFLTESVKANYRTMQQYAGDGTPNRVYEFNFEGGYINKVDVKAFAVHDVTRERHDLDVTFIGSNTVTLSETVAVQWTVTIYRDTVKGKPLAKFVDGAVINAFNLDRNAQQAVFSVAEMIDRFDSVVADVESALVKVYESNLKADEALLTANAALTKSDTAITTSNEAKAGTAVANTKADAAVVTANEAKATATGIDAKATTALSKATTAETNAATALSTANAIDGKASTALAQSTVAVTTANDAKTQAAGVDGKATEALSTANAAQAKINTALPLTGGPLTGQISSTITENNKASMIMATNAGGGATSYLGVFQGGVYNHVLAGAGYTSLQSKVGTTVSGGGLFVDGRRPSTPAGPGGYGTAIELGSGGISNSTGLNGFGLNPNGTTYLWNTATGNNPSYTAEFNGSTIRLNRPTTVGGGLAVQGDINTVGNINLGVRAGDNEGSQIDFNDKNGATAAFIDINSAGELRVVKSGGANTGEKMTWAHNGDLVIRSLRIAFGSSGNAILPNGNILSSIWSGGELYTDVNRRAIKGDNRLTATAIMWSGTVNGNGPFAIPMAGGHGDLRGRTVEIYGNQGGRDICAVVTLSTRGAMQRVVFWGDSALQLVPINSGTNLELSFVTGITVKEIYIMK